MQNLSQSNLHNSSTYSTKKQRIGTQNYINKTKNKSTAIDFNKLGIDKLKEYM